MVANSETPEQLRSHYTTNRTPLPRVDPTLAGEEVPEHHRRGRDDLREHVPLVADKAAAQPHDRLVQPQADDGERDEDDKLAHPRKTLAVREHIAHGRDVVEHSRHAVRDTREQIRQLDEGHRDGKARNRTLWFHGPR